MQILQTTSYDCSSLIVSVTHNLYEIELCQGNMNRITGKYLGDVDYGISKKLLIS